MRWLLTVAGAALVCLGSVAVANSGRLDPPLFPRLCSAVPTPQHLIELGSLSAGEVPDEVLLRGPDDALVREGLAISGEAQHRRVLVHKPKKQTERTRVVFWEDVYAVKSSVPG